MENKNLNLIALKINKILILFLILSKNYLLKKMIFRAFRSEQIYTLRKKNLVNKRREIVCSTTKNSQFKWTDHISTEMSNFLKKSKRQRKN